MRKPLNFYLIKELILTLRIKKALTYVTKCRIDFTSRKLELSTLQNNIKFSLSFGKKTISD